MFRCMFNIHIMLSTDGLVKCNYIAKGTDLNTSAFFISVLISIYFCMFNYLLRQKVGIGKMAQMTWLMPMFMYVR